MDNMLVSIHLRPSVVPLSHVFRFRHRGQEESRIPQIGSVNLHKMIFLDEAAIFHHDIIVNLRFHERLPLFMRGDIPKHEAHRESFLVEDRGVEILDGIQQPSRQHVT